MSQKQRTKIDEETASALEGRLICLEAMVTTLLAHAADATGDPPEFIRAVMASVATQLERAAAEAPPDGRRPMGFALEAFGAISDGMLRHVGLYGRVVQTN